MLYILQPFNEEKNQLKSTLVVEMSLSYKKSEKLNPVGFSEEYYAMKLKNSCFSFERHPKCCKMTQSFNSFVRL